MKLDGERRHIDFIPKPYCQWRNAWPFRSDSTTSPCVVGRPIRVLFPSFRKNGIASSDIQVPYEARCFLNIVRSPIRKLLSEKYLWRPNDIQRGSSSLNIVPRAVLSGAFLQMRFLVREAGGGSDPNTIRYLSCP